MTRSPTLPLCLMVLVLAAPCLGDTYAVMFQGGWFPWADFGFFAAQVDFYNCLRASGIQADHIYAYEGDGVVDPDNLNCNVMSHCYYGYEYDTDNYYNMLYDSPVDYDGDGIPDVKGAGTAANLFSKLSDLASIMTEHDSLILQIGDHGGADPARFGAWLNDSVYWTDVADALNAIPSYNHQLVIVGTCHAAASFEHLATLGSRRITITASLADYYSWYRMPTYFWGGPRHLELSEPGGSGFITALVEATTKADTNANGLIDMHELFLHTYNNDEFGPNGWFDWSVYPPEMGYHHETPCFSDPDCLWSKVAWGVSELIWGDANTDGSVDIADLGQLATHYGTTTGATWQMGDFNNDHAIDIADLGVLATNYGTLPASIPIPEPSTIAILAFGGVLLLWRTLNGSPRQVLHRAS